MVPRNSRTKAVADPRSAVKRLQGWARHHFIETGVRMVEMKSVTLACRGLMREYIDEYGLEGLIPDRKNPLTNELIDGMLSTPDGTKVGHLVVEWDSYYWTSLYALFCVLAESGERKDEVAKANAATPFRKGRFTWNIGSSRLRTGSCRIKSELVFGQITALILTGAFIDQPDLTSRLLRTQNQTSPSAQPSLCRCKPTASRCKLCPPACPPPARRSRGLSTSIFTRARRSSHVAVHGGRAQSTRALICFCRRCFACKVCCPRCATCPPSTQ